MIIDQSLKPEEHKINIDEKVVIIGGSYKAVAAGMISLLHILEGNENELILPIIKIRDYPDASYRGLMIDLARKWHKLETLKKLIDMSAYYKLNYIQLHLTDDQSFTFPSSKYTKIATEHKQYNKSQ